jgi:hypothetical protein
MPSTFTPLLRLELQADGENDTTWGQIVNDNVISLIEDSVAGEAAISTTGGTTTLSTNDGAVDQARYAVLKVTGTLSSDATLEVPSGVTKPYLVVNDTSGSFTVEVLVAGQSAGAGVVIPQGYQQRVYCDGSDVEPAGLPIDDSESLLLRDGSDQTKRADFDLSNITAGNTRTLIVPDAGGTIAFRDVSQTFTGTQTYTGTIDVSGATLTLANNQISGDKIDGGTISNFASIGIDDNASSTVITITGGGNVGFGTASPGFELDVNNTINASRLTTGSPTSVTESSGEVLRFEGTAGGLIADVQGGHGRFAFAWNAYYDGDWLYQKDNENAAFLGIGTNTGSVSPNNGEAVVIGSAQDSGSSGADTTVSFNLSSFSYDTIALSTQETERLRIDSSGQVGIGTTSPSYALDVVGDVRVNQGQLRVDSVHGGELRTRMSRLDGGGTSQSTWGWRVPSDDKLRLRDYDNGVEPFTVALNTTGTLRLSANAVWADSGNPVFRIEADTDSAICNLDFGDTSASGVGRVRYDHSVDAMFFQVNGAERIRIDDSGQVGIGTNSPQEQLHIVTGSGAQVRLDDTTGYSVLDAFSGGNLKIAADQGNGNANSFIRFDVDATEHVRIDSSGQVGIGTSSPGHPLDVNGDAQVRQNLGVGGLDPFGSSTNQLRVGDSAVGSAPISSTANLIVEDGDGVAGIQMVAPSTGSCQLFFGDADAANSGSIVYDHNNDNMTIDVNGSERARIDSNGNVLIGTTTASINSSNFGTRIAASGLTKISRDIDGASITLNVFGNAGEARILGDGDLANTNGNYGTISDPSLKQDVTPAHSQWDDVRDLGQRFVNYRLKDAVERQGDGAPTLLSVLADDDFAARFPGLTKTGEDGYRSFKQSVASMKGLVALSEALTRIEQLETRLAQLEG